MIQKLLLKYEKYFIEKNIENKFKLNVMLNKEKLD